MIHINCPIFLDSMPRTVPVIKIKAEKNGGSFPYAIASKMGRSMQSDPKRPKLKRPIVVLKFGGTSLSDGDRIRRACYVARERHRSGFAAVVVVSAQAAITDRLLEQAAELAAQPDLRELDLLLSSGERISAALFAICLNAAGIEAIALTGSQAGIITDNCHTHAQIVEVRPFRIAEALQEGKVVVVGGFQGVSNQKEITTLGRGGSDITAVALAGALNAELCEIFSDVDGVYSADPRVVAAPRKLERLSFSDMEELARAGAKVLHPDAVALARKGNVRLHARSSFEPHASGTIIEDLAERSQERILGIASLREIHWCRIRGESRQLLTEMKVQSVRPLGCWGSGGGENATWNFLVAGRDNPPLSSIFSDWSHQFAVDVLSGLCVVTLVGTERVDSAQVIAEITSDLGRCEVELLHLESAAGKFRLVIEDRNHDKVVASLYGRLIAGGSQSEI